MSFINLTELKGVRIDLRYASANNFTGQNLYGDFDQALLHPLAFEKLKKALSWLNAHHPDLQFLILDALRPRRIQRVLFSHVVGTDKESYVANPDRGSVHNYGLAVDLTLCDSQGKELDLGTIFDDFTDLAQPQFEEKFLRERKLTLQQWTRRKILRESMRAGDFRSIPNEWWHFNALMRHEITDEFTIFE